MNYEEYTAPDGPWTEIDGWNQQGVFTALKEIHEVQQARSISGNIGEIGIHDGQFFFALMLLANTKKELCLAVDIFDDQERNIDCSGGSSFESFHEKLVRIIDKKRIKKLRLIQDDSLGLKPETLIATANSAFIDSMGVLDACKFNSEQTSGFRLFSIDGGHTVVHALNDLRLVERVMTPGGVVIVDDFMHPGWPGVTEGLHIYCSDRSSRLVPFAYGNNKMYLTTFDFAIDIREAFAASAYMKENLQDFKKVQMYGRNVYWVEFS